MNNSSKWLVASGKSFVVCCLLFSVLCDAEELVDPMRPPAGISAPAVAADAQIKPASLQSILISKNRRAAIIDGQTVELGGRLGNAKLIEVNAVGVVLQTSKGRKVLKLYPDVKIISAKTELVPVYKKVTEKK